ncbi:DUF309 domain-containing protein [Niallia sp. Sow4_A1]|uniref:DUF309 domain-containing protein n=1 Tax=Bacillaceae TaxID=186817 RepID=UPI001F1AE538|nr:MULTISPECIES: DUF309 domain-containing protein [Bacillaceae]MCF2647575.1 DUF309 domain-containing protein [Niallia circulans]MCM3361839.1 DUF309 domain-containing protein [Niallia sp. MER TA 168]CAI9387979.1 hypothetical protein BACSP_02175 [Bacillus sp. T2.9-1]
MYPKEYLQFLVHFHGDQDFFECHEILEEYWKKVDCRNKESIWVGFILMAVSAYHHRRENFKGAHKTIMKSRKLLEKHKEGLHALGLDGEGLLYLLRQQEKNIAQTLLFRPYPLPISDSHLEKQCRKLAHSMEISWNNQKDIPIEIIHRHLKRDRSLVIQEREEAIQKRQRE